ncbi:MAG TPA: sensor domain-containing diguanylate cyclase [Devosia sp.]|nr:sensor domain-containing diguanylate cyclase [Devosia sp.]
MHVPTADLSQAMLDLAPVSLWLEDYTALKALFERWRAEGVTDLAALFRQDPDAVRTCAGQIRVITVNQRTHELFESRDLDHLVGNLATVFRDDMMDTHGEEMLQLWNGRHDFSNVSVNYSLNGRRIDIQMTGRILPGYEGDWSRVLVAIEDVTERETARREAAAAARHAAGLFEHSPVSLWVEDFSGIKLLLEEVRQQGIEDFRVFTDVHPEFVERCMAEIRVIDVNSKTVELLAAPDKATVARRMEDIFRDEMARSFREQLIDLWEGKLFQVREVANYTLEGEQLHVLMQFSVLPGHEDDWSLVQVALTDITARKKAEAYLEFLGKHDELTKLHNRSFYVDELNRLERKNSNPVSVVIVDVNGLKAANDMWGHAAGDSLLRRAGEVLAKAIEKPACAARIGGDEFALLLPGADEAMADAMLASIDALLVLNNQFYPGAPLSLAVGAATRRAGEKLEETIKRADAVMYRAKLDYYSDSARDLRAAQAEFTRWQDAG